MNSIKRLLLLFFTFSVVATSAQIIDPVKWKFSQKQISDTEVELYFEATLEKKWHLYAQKLESDMGPVPTSFVFEESAQYERMGEVKEPKPKVEYDPNFEMNLSFFEKQVKFTQRIKIKSETDFKLKGYVEYMVCDDEKCLPPTEVDFLFIIKGASSAAENTQTDSTTVIEGGEDDTTDIVEKQTDIQQIIPALPNVDLQNPLGNCGKTQEIGDTWLVFIFGFIGGLLALLTPCVFPMIPLTVSFFTKGSEDKKGVFRAVLYGFFIFLIYALLSIPFHFGTDPEALNEIATSVWLNLLFFAVFLVFAISFFGYFEITLPNSMMDKTNKASDVGGVFGIFFMALTLALVSFSCTGPILGTVLGNSLKNGPWPITAAMSGFGVALGLPFALFAAFPSVMNKLPKSGGWLNSVKVVLGFIELALAVKFLSNADLVLQWGILKRETFFLIWAIIGLALVFYLFGVIRFPHDSPSTGKSSVFKKVFTLSILAFTIYLIPGIMKSPLWNHNLLSGFPPPSFYSWYDNETFHAEFTDFESAIAEAQKQNKPLLIDFTGWACVNCRKMEETVWTVDAVKQKLENDFVLVSLYVDDKVKLPDSLQGVFSQEINGEIVEKKIRTIGNKWATFQTQVFNNNSQPYYVMLTPDGYLLGNPVGYMPDEKEYLDWLNCGLNANEKIAQ